LVDTPFAISNGFFIHDPKPGTKKVLEVLVWNPQGGGYFRSKSRRNINAPSRNLTMRQYGGGNEDDFFKPLTDAQCALPEEPSNAPKGGRRNRKTRRRKQKSKRKYTRR
jgi:hypothetical protein